jgi:hypothetical protein
MMTRVVALVALSALAACGRTAESTHASYACAEDLAGDCGSLRDAHRDLAKTYVKEVSGKEPDFARAQSISACTRDVVDQEIATQCLPENINRCVALCDLHPCALAPGIIAACPQACEDIANDEKIAGEAIELATLSATEHPGLCTCQVCDGGAKKLCTSLWACPD